MIFTPFNFIWFLSESDYEEIEGHFSKNRSTLPLMFIATPIDKLKSSLTKKKPTAPILQRLAALAKQSFEVLEKQLYVKHFVGRKGHNADYKVVFFFLFLFCLFVFFCFWKFALSMAVFLKGLTIDVCPFSSGPIRRND